MDFPATNGSGFSSSSSAFFVFCSDHRPRIKEENPGISIGDIAKKLGELWATQSSKDKAPYEAKAAKLKEKYEKVPAVCEGPRRCFRWSWSVSRLSAGFLKSIKK